MLRSLVGSEMCIRDSIHTSNRKLKPEETKKEITTKELIKLKFFHLMNYMLFLAHNVEEQNEIIDLEEKLTNIKGGIKKDFSESQCGKELEKGLKSWLKPFFSTSKPDNFQLKDHWDTWDGIIESNFFKKHAQQGIIPVEDKEFYNPPKRRPAENNPTFQDWSSKVSLNQQNTNGELYEDYKRKRREKKLESVEKIRSSPFYKIYKNVVASEEIYNIAEKKFEDEIIKLKIKTDKDNLIFDKDEHPRNNLIIDDLKKLKTAFKENGTVTPGNSSGINDGAAATVLMSRKQAELKSIEPLVKIVSWASCGVEPSLMGLGPIPAVKEALKKADWSIADVDLFEINEAFAAQSIAVIKDLKIHKEIVNVNGGAIAMGHPLGATGAMILGTALDELERSNKSTALVTLCVASGMGSATIIERI